MFMEELLNVKYLIVLLALSTTLKHQFSELSHSVANCKMLSMRSAETFVINVQHVKETVIINE